MQHHKIEMQERLYTDNNVYDRFAPGQALFLSRLASPSFVLFDVSLIRIRSGSAHFV